jgi:hypothetical protein
METYHPAEQIHPVCVYTGVYRREPYGAGQRRRVFWESSSMAVASYLWRSGLLRVYVLAYSRNISAEIQ